MCRDLSTASILQALRDESMYDPRDRIEMAQSHALYRPSLLGQPWASSNFFKEALIALVMWACWHWCIYITFDKVVVVFDEWIFFFFLLNHINCVIYSSCSWVSLPFSVLSIFYFLCYDKKGVWLCKLGEKEEWNTTSVSRTLCSSISFFGLPWLFLFWSYEFRVTQLSWLQA